MQTINKIKFTAADYNSQKKEIFINLNNHPEIDAQINSVEKLRLIDIESPSGNIRSFVFSKMDKWEMIFETGKGITARFGYK